MWCANTCVGFLVRYYADIKNSKKCLGELTSRDTYDKLKAKTSHRKKYVEYELIYISKMRCVCLSLSA